MNRNDDEESSRLTVVSGSEPGIVGAWADLIGERRFGVYVKGKVGFCLHANANGNQVGWNRGRPALVPMSELRQT